MQLRAFLLRFRLAILLCLAGFLLAACQESGVPKDMKPVPAKLIAKMQQENMAIDAPIYIRAYKESSELEVWKQRRDGTYGLLNTYSICKWSGKLGPKIKEGDRQAPEGFYTITPGQMNPRSNYYLSFNIGFPNAYDRALGRTGTNIMVHGACSSAGCYSMTDESAGEIYALARDAFRGGQRAFEVNLYPFRMTAENMARHRKDPNYEFWAMLKEGSDHFAVTRKVPVVGVCGRKYVFDVDSGGAKLSASDPCPPYKVPDWLDAAVKQKQAKDEIVIAALATKYEADQQAAEAKVAADAELAAAKARSDAAAAATPAPVPATEASVTGSTAAQADDAASAPVGGVPAPGVPLPVPSPLRATAAPAPAAPPAEQPGFWNKMKKKLSLSG